MDRKRRTDAERNRLRILAAARAAFAGGGLDVPVREVARRAGIGTATVYRHFPSRQDLVAAVLARHAARCGEDMRAALADPDPRRALRGTIVRFGEQQVRDRYLTEALLDPHGPGAAFAGQRRAHAAGFARLVARAREQGAVRGQVTVEDARVALMAITSFRTLPPDRASPAVRRLTDLLLAGVFAEEPAGPAGPAL